LNFITYCVSVDLYTAGTAGEREAIIVSDEQREEEGAIGKLTTCIAICEALCSNCRIHASTVFSFPFFFMYYLKPCSHPLLEQNSPLVHSKCRNKWKGEANPVCCGKGRTHARILLQRCSNQSSDSSSPRIERVSKPISQKSVVTRRDMLVVVEGTRDMRAVRRAVDLDVSVPMYCVACNLNI
jgi:hypothetical protein